jgi:hypothetical protein
MLCISEWVCKYGYTLSDWLSCLKYKYFFCQKCSCGWQWMQEVKIYDLNNEIDCHVFCMILYLWMKLCSGWQLCFCSFGWNIAHNTSFWKIEDSTLYPRLSTSSSYLHDLSASYRIGFFTSLHLTCKYLVSVPCRNISNGMNVLSLIVQLICVNFRWV